ncbi:EthD family reductase [Phreatobacter sp.]|uniref:EthD family reductase n=1 Tax=Phreatobacter sp. TaxID=1966341 RepID=UPI003F6E7C8F
MHRLLVLYNEPQDPAHFRSYYVENHLPLASKIPGVKAATYTFDVKTLGPGMTSYFCIFSADFESEAALMSALASPEGQATAADIANYASGGASLLHFPIG